MIPCVSRTASTRSAGSAIREIFKMIAKPGMISFAGGNPAASALPDAECAEIARDVLQKDGKRILQYGASEGYPPLLESLRAYVEQQLGCAVPAVLPSPAQHRRWICSAKR